MSRAEYDALKRESDRLPELMRERGGEWSDEDERQFQRWVGDMRLD